MGMKKPSIEKDQKETELEEKMNYCEECGQETDNYQMVFMGKFYICEECQECLYCECGNRLEDAYGSPGDGFCIECR
jgi:ssDNA-binding Zn-finger/Zn-ribbon topoisomerase 1